MTPAKKKPPADKVVDLETELDWPRILLDVLTEYGEPATAGDVAKLTGIELPKVTEHLDALVSDGQITLGDDSLYRLPDWATPDPEQDIIGPPVPQEESDAAGAESLSHDDIPRSRTVNLPTSDLVAFLSHVNLPPELIAGFGLVSSVSGQLTYDLMDGDGNDLEATCDFIVEIRGRHRITQPRLNPNQPGYVSPITRSMVSHDPDSLVDNELGAS
jgi:hypothetical protein